jgi:hypothetical protein
MARDIPEIHNDITETRARLRVTAEAIGWKADVPARARDVVRETVAVVRGRVAEGSTAPPLTAGRDADDDGPGVTERAGEVASAVGRGAGAMKDAVVGGAGAAAGRAGALKDAAMEAAGAVGEQASQAKDAVAGTANAVSERAEAAGRAASSAARGAAGDVADRRDTGTADTIMSAARSPAGIAAGALVAGAVVGLLMPATRAERERVGPVVDDLRERGREIGEEALQRGAEAADSLADAAKDRS